MQVLHNFSKEVIDTIKQLGTIVSDFDEHGNVINYYNLPQWFKDVNGHIFDCPVSELPKQAKYIQTNYNSGIKEWYDGDHLKSSVNYYATDKEVNAKIEFIRFMGHTGKYDGDPVQMSLYIRFKDGTDKWFLCEQNEDGSFPPNVYDVVLRKADEYLGTLQNEGLVV